ncbi:MAG: hypothetical protein K2K42_01385 [Eubacterium sp.]|nr:hypothetical protein [Eubacterium sp.]
MDIKFNKFVFKLDFSFLILLSFAVFYGYKNTVDIILFSLAHEIGHIAALLLFKVKPDLIKVSFYGIGLKYKNNLSKTKEFIVLLCGPLVNLIFFLILKDEINLILLLINIFPALPLDGGRVIKLITPKYSKAISLFFIIILSCFSAYLFIEYHIFSLVLISIYLIAFNLNEFTVK